ncbi:MAG: endo-1,4-beta-xylanase [Treponema sp.]|jgi:endo-1,4-beta-xylanase|nr:endo-1,4-beta-xylanase [Treponema sp.]
MKKIIFFTANITLFFFLITACKTNSGNAVQKTADPSQPPLYTKWPFMVGAAVPNGAFSPGSDQYDLLRHYNVLVAENEMKPDAFLPPEENGAYRWTKADMLVSYAQENNKKIRGHTLVWHNQTPAWFFAGSGSGGLAAKEQLYARMENHIKTVFEKYGGRIGWWDVCNEPVGDDGSPRDATSSKYSAIMVNSGLKGMNRYEYVLQAFRWARKYADANGGQGVKLYLNDYNIEYNGAKQSEFIKLVNWLIENNAPIDGIGLQCHIKWDWPSTAQISNAIDKFSAITRKDGVKLTTQVTELDMSLFSSNETSFNGGQILLTLPDIMRDRRLPAQAKKYRELFDMFKQKYEEGKLEMVLIWGIADGHSWLNHFPARGRTDYPLPFDRDYQPKQVYWELVR